MKRLAINFLIFCAALSYWEFLLYTLCAGNADGIAVWNFIFIPAEAMLFAALSGWFRNKTADRIVNFIVMLAAAVFYIAQMLYFRTFGSMFSVSMIGMGGDAIKNFGWGLMVTVKESAGLILLYLIPPLVYVAALALLKKEIDYKPAFHALALLLAVSLWFGAAAALPLGGTESYSPYAAYFSGLVDTDTASSKIGVLANSAVEFASLFKDADESEDGELAQLEEETLPVDDSPNAFDWIDFAALSASSEKKSVKDLCDYLGSVKPTERNEYTGLFADCNLIYICAESFSELALDERLTPTLCRLASEGIVLTNYYNSFKNTTTNGEYALLTGLWPDVSRDAKRGTAVGSFAQSAKKFMPIGLGTVFSERCGCTSRAYHNYLGSYYCRNTSLPNLGFECKFMDDGMKFSSSWPASDLEMMEQSVGDYIYDERFCVYYMTFSSHGPYSSDNVMYKRNIGEVKEVFVDSELTDNALGYLACNLELEKAMTYLLERLEQAGKAENTVIVLAGDHYPYYLADSARDSITGGKPESDFENYKDCCILWNGGLEEPIVCDRCCCNVDIYPTILNLFGLEYDSRLIAGTDIFSSGTHIAALYNKSFVTDYVKYDSAKGKAEWLPASSVLNSDNLSQYLDRMNTIVKNRYSASLKIADTNLYKLLWDFKEARSEQLLIDKTEGR